MTSTARTPASVHALAVAVILCAVMATGCSNEVSGVTRVEAKIDGLTCPSCVPPLKASLEQTFKTAGIEVDDETDLATLQFDNGQPFSAAALRRAAADVRMHVVEMRMQACGRIESSGGELWLKAGDSRFKVQSTRELPLDQPLCLDGRLDSGGEPATFAVDAFEAQAKG